MPERSAAKVARMEGSPGHRLVSARSALALGVLAFALNIAGLVLVAASGE